MEHHVANVYERYDKRRKEYEAALADQEDDNLLDDLQKRIDEMKQ